MKTIEIAGRKIGAALPCFIIAEAGVNHNGRLQTAHDLVDAAATAGADAVKFQTWITERICAPGAKKAAYQETRCPDEADQFAMLKKLEMPYDWHPELQRHARERGVVFLSTPDDIQSARFLCDLGVPALKVGSAELTNLPFLRQLAALGKSLILSTGMGTGEEIREALAVIAAEAPVPVALLHCVSAYPAPEEELNLRCLATLRDEFCLPVGLSDHTAGSLAAAVAVGLGMAILEKHLTLDKQGPGPDHAASADPAGFAELVRTVRRAERMLGNGLKAPTASEADARATVRRTLLYAADLPAGHELEQSDVAALRCGMAGLGPEAILPLLGRRLKRAARAGTAVNLADFE